MRIAVVVRLAHNELARRAQVVDDSRVRLEDLHSGVRAGFRGEAAARVDGVDDRQAVAHAGLEIVLAVTGCGVHGAGAGLELDVVGEHDRGVAVEERMPHREPFERAAFDLRAQCALAFAHARENRRRQRFGGDHVLVTDTVHAVRRIRLQRDRDVRGERPRRRRPDDERQRGPVVVQPELREHRRALRIGRAEADVDRGGRVVLVLDLRFG